ncbi:MAG TPA: HTTM domain-containing protein [Pyrinomonadaceae bacterium]|nr:HTTM domain-containing protein [Pyrinomonadaceae bacterium]
MQTVPRQEVPVAAPFVVTPSSAEANFLQRTCAALFNPVDISFLVFFRILFGGIMLWEVYRYFTYGWIARYFIEPVVTFTYYGFSWVQPWPGRGMYIHFFVLGLAAACVIAGFLYRIAAPIFFLAFTYSFLLDQTRYLNHFYLVCLVSFLMCFLPAQRAFSVDALLRRKIRSDVVPAWTLWLLRAQVGIPYFYGGIAKLNSDWIHGGEPMRTWLSPLTRAPGIGHIFAADWVVYSFVIGGLMLDLLVVPLLVWRRTRLFAFAAAVVFNLINAVIFEIGIFPWLMLGALLIFFPPDLLRRFARAFMSPGEEFDDAEPSPASVKPKKTIAEGSSCPALSTSQKFVAGLLAAYLAVQLLLPLRHYLYPGNVSWTEEGHNFAWHMKLRTKVGEAVFTVTHPGSGQTWTIKPEDYLKPHQLMKVITKPDLLVQFSHFLAEEKRREGYENVEVRARAMVSLNGRQPQLLIDPNVDLAKEHVSLLPTRWIVPLTTPLGTRGTRILVDED